MLYDNQAPMNEEQARLAFSREDEEVTSNTPNGCVDTPYFKGDAARWTGEQDLVDGLHLAEARLIEGHRTGQCVWLDISHWLHADPKLRPSIWNKD